MSAVEEGALDSNISVRADRVDSARLSLLSALFDEYLVEARGAEALVPLWHWTLFQPNALQKELGVDGHPKSTEYMVPLELPRRMWAGSEVEFISPAQMGESIERVSTLHDSKLKSGRSGSLLFVQIKHEISQAGQLRVREVQDLVYREAAKPSDPTAPGVDAPRDETFSKRMVIDPVFLFRYSALTFNAHRIHYDREYAVKAEGYPGLVVHGPLLATLLLRLARSNFAGKQISRFKFKAVRPVIDTDAFEICGRQTDDHSAALWVRDHQGYLATQASVEFLST